MPKDWIQTFTGRKFSPLDPRPEDIDIRDIAHALSNMCRFTGQCSRFYSVAEHSALVSLRLTEVVGLSPEGLKIVRWGLLHDASEAYISDVSRPLKHQPEFAAYRAIEKRLQEVICSVFGLDPVEPPVVKTADLEMLGTEVAQLMQPLHPEWAATTATGGLYPPLTGYLWDTRRLGLQPGAAEGLFLDAFQFLFTQTSFT